MVSPTLLRRAHPLADVASQRCTLAALPLPEQFDETLARVGKAPLLTTEPQILQLNLGKKCNQTCRHCHVDAGPERQEVMGDEVLDACLRLLETSRIPTVDITGGAPELHPRFRALVTRARELGRHVMDRCNLTILTVGEQRDLSEFLAENQVEIMASLPHVGSKQTDTQRGDGVFERSLIALKRLNGLGYGAEGSGLRLNLVTNPVGAFLPAGQASLEREWKRELGRRYGVTFNRLFTITNMPISRYLEFLVDSGNLNGYMEKLANSFNPAAVDGLMCRNTLSIGWDGALFDCDFNQMLEMHLPWRIQDVSLDQLVGRTILTGPHCYGCTAGAGSSCGGATAT